MLWVVLAPAREVGTKFIENTSPDGVKVIVSVPWGTVTITTIWPLLLVVIEVVEARPRIVVGLVANANVRSLRLKSVDGSENEPDAPFELPAAFEVVSTIG